MFAFESTRSVGSLLCSSLLFLGVVHGGDLKSPLSPEQSLDQFKLAPGLQIELAASEPLVVDPVAIRFDERGRMWVVEMRDYPHGPAEGEAPRSRIVVLEDRNNDGKFEHSTVFADKLLFATGLQPWKGGVFVTLAGEVAYMKDTDGDGACDFRETWFTGFAQENTQLRANHPRLGLDNYIYIANGLRGGTVVDARDPKAKPVSISGMDFRFDPLSGEFEAVSGIGQFGLAFDDFGNRFVCTNRNPVKHIVLQDYYLKKNPHAAISTVFQDVAKAGAESRIFAISRAWTTSNLHAGQFTAACGVHVFRGSGLGKDFRGNVFTCDPTGNLVHREIMKPVGPTFVSHPGREGVEFLASPDEWFRPVNLEVGPDGALYVVDMYRAVIEHPQFMPTELKTRSDLLRGSDRGRIYRIRSSNQKNNLERANYFAELLASADIRDLVGYLDTSNPWLCDTVARLLLERQDKTVVPWLENQNAIHFDDLAARPLWLLDGLKVLKREHVLDAMSSDAEPHLRRQGVLFSEAWIESDEKVRDRVRQLAKDSSADVRFQVALSLAPATGREDELALWAIIQRDLGDPWTERAVQIAAGEHAGSLAIRLLNEDLTELDARKVSPLMSALIAQAVSRGEKAEHAKLLRDIFKQAPASERRQRVALLAFARSLSKRRQTLDAIVKTASDKDLGDSVERVVHDANESALDAKQPIDARIEAIELLGLTMQANALIKLADAGSAQQIRLAAIEGLAGSVGTLEMWESLLARFSSESPSVRAVLLAGALARADRTGLLLDAVEAERIKVSELDQAATSRLLKHRDASLQQRAKKLFAASIPADRQKVLQEYQVVLGMKADATHGRLVFQKNCANCHRIGELGVNVAPDISDSRTKQPAQILADVLQPNRAIDNNYIGYNVITVNGQVLSGILTSETATTITLQQPEGKSATLLRSEIDEIRSTGVSLMPEGLEKNIPHQAMADLISFIKNWRYLDGKTPLSKATQ